MAVVWIGLCAIRRTDCWINAEAEGFLRKAVRSKKKVLSTLVNEFGVTPLGVASGAGCTSYLKDLVKAGCDINGLDRWNLTALCIASGYGELGLLPS
jgi:ankyrin repeat protein